MVEAIGADVSGFRKGQEVYGCCLGGYAEYALAKAEDIQPKPANVTFEEAASVPMGRADSVGRGHGAANVKAEQRVLVHGGAGGVGGYAVQLARWKRSACELQPPRP